MTETQTLNRHGVQPGDIFYSSWGYDQTNIDYYQVVRVTAAKAELRPIGAKRVGEHGDRVVPNPDYTREYDVILRVERSDVVKTKLCTTRSGGKSPSVVLRSGHHWGYLWTGGSQYETPAEMGH